MSASQESVGAIIAAAGRSQRMGGGDKLFAVVGGGPLLAHTLSAFDLCPSVERVVLVLSLENIERGRELVAEAGFGKVAAVCQGGERRQDSVCNGLEALASCQWVVVHDGARPLVTAELIERGLEAAKETGAAIAALPIGDTVKEVEPAGIIGHTLSRGRLWAAQTPQVFRYDILREAHQRAQGEATDDAALVEKLGYQVRVFEGSPWNIKVTTAADLVLVEALLAQGRAG
ncbi:MAG: 2-C-methyl-D-erythritol 4-phosphate cytidylyltransferase [Dehalococcoidia bacterium SM23_28_2]|nr:MAG: 2-C-methyl-D-erythritol 4-phosphate cytidylyltransferase [Dehalococcoidia bacterium SM23_28_2]